MDQRGLAYVHVAQEKGNTASCRAAHQIVDHYS
jgi:hypothetical protein